MIAAQAVSYFHCRLKILSDALITEQAGYCSIDLKSNFWVHSHPSPSVVHSYSSYFSEYHLSHTYAQKNI